MSVGESRGSHGAMSGDLLKEVSGSLAAAPVRRDAPMPWVRLLLHPAHSLPAAAAPVLVGVALAIHDGVFSPLPATLGLLASWLIHVGGLFWENYWLLTRHAGLREHPELAAAVENGSLSLAALRRVTLVWFALGVLSGSYLVTCAGMAAPVLGLIGIIASAGYCSGRYSLTRLGIADPVFFIMFGVVAVAGTYYTQAASHDVHAGNWGFVAAALPLKALVIGLPLGAIITGVMLADDLSDIEVDLAKGWRTSAVRWGVPGTRLEYTGLMVMAYGLPFWFWRGLRFEAWILLPLLSLPLAIWAVKKMWTIEPAKVEPLSPRTAAIGFLYAGLLSAGLLLSHSG